MQYLGMNALRKAYLDFFESKDHTRLKSFSLVPDGDASLLLINAGMAPLKGYFLGEKKMNHNRATSSQRCLRTADIDNVGKTARHATFFEMLGNFSFGNYFKREAIHWAWEFLTKVIQLDPEKIWVSVYEKDQEAYDIWAQEIGFPEAKLLRLGKEDNFWELEQGPCGPCSEIHYDRGPAYGEGTSPVDNSDRFMEIWNLVFTQFNKEADGSYTPLAHPNIDTGMGLERLALLLEDKDNIFELDEFLPLRDAIAKLSGKVYGQDPKTDSSFRVIIDHSKAINFLIYDGVIPSNEGRGYVLRRLLRRAARHGKLLGIEGKFLTKLSDYIVEAYREEYPELGQAKERIYRVIEREEENFQQTIDQGLAMLEDLIDQAQKEGQKVLDPEKVFRLYDTYGFPLDLTKEIAAERGKELDEEDFAKRMLEQKDQSRARRKDASGWDKTIHYDTTGLAKTDFSGYSLLKNEGKVLAIFAPSGEKRDQLKAGEEGLLVFDRTPFYAESGGQVADQGRIFGPGVEIRVEDVKKDKEEIFLHYVSLNMGQLAVGDSLTLEVDSDRRNDIRRNHSATHLLNKALHMVLGDHINQAGSMVGPDRLRFDFTHFQAMTDQELAEVERIVNRAIFLSYPVITDLLPLEQAMAEGAIGLFEDKYKDVVRVLSMGDFSKELCGGTHVDNTAQVMMFRILSEQGVSSGVRRIEAITGRACYQQILDYDQLIQEEADLLQTKRDQLLPRTKQVLEEKKALEKEVAAFASAQTEDLSAQLLRDQEEVGDFRLLRKHLSGKTMQELKDLADSLQEKAGDALIALASDLDGKVFWVVAAGKTPIANGIQAGDLVKELAKQTGGNGGGRPNFATAGGKDKEKIDLALEAIIPWIKARRK